MKKWLIGILLSLGVLLIGLIILGYGTGVLPEVVAEVSLYVTPNERFAKLVAGYQKTETEHIQFYYPQGVVYPEGDLKKMEQAYEDASRFFGVNPMQVLGQKLRFVWLPGASRYDRSRFKEVLGFTSQGKALPKEGILFSIFSYTPHELNHVVTETYAEPPALFDEGFANYLNKIRWESNVHQVLVTANQAGELIPVEKLLTTANFKRYDSQITYAEGGMLMKFLVEEKGKGSFLQLYQVLDGVKKQQQIVAVFEEVYGQSFDSLVVEWEDYLQQMLSK